MANFRLADRDTGYLLPPSVDEWLPEDHLARFVVDIVDELDISSLEGSYTGSGSDAYHPRMMLALLFYSYATSTFSSRKIEAATYDSVATRYVAANDHPDHDTICTFRRRFLEPLEELFVQILLIATEMNLVEIGDVTIDGTKVKANASKRKAMSWGRACQLEEQLNQEVDQLMARAEDADQEQADHQQLPEEIARRKERLEQIRQAKEMIKDRAEQRYQAEKTAYEQKMVKRERREQATGKKTPGRKPKPPARGPREKDQVNFTDSESRIMPTSNNGFQQAYNGQAAVDMDSYLILAGHLSQASNDKNQLKPALEALEKLPQKLGSPRRIAADAGYFSEDNVKLACKHKLEPYLSASRSEHHPNWKEYITQPDPPPEDAGLVQQMKWRLQTKQGKAFYAKRKSTIEPVFGVLKQVLGFRQFLLRGLQRASGEWKLLQCAYNLKKMHVLASQ